MLELYNKNINKVLRLNAEGLSNREIADIIGVHHSTIGNWLKQNNTVSSRRQPIEMVSENLAKCKRCEEVKPLFEFQFGRKGKKDEYRYAFCNECRRTQIRHSMNDDPKRAMKDRFNRLRRRAKSNNIPFDLSFEYYYGIFEKQKRRCFYTDVMLDWSYGNGQNFLSDVSVDKIIPELGYVKGNIVFTTTRVNSAKSNFSLDEVRRWMPDWYSRLINNSIDLILE